MLHLLICSRVVSLPVTLLQLSRSLGMKNPDIFLLANCMGHSTRLDWLDTHLASYRRDGINWHWIP